MDGYHPKRRKDKDNPYQIWKEEEKYYISFVDVIHEKHTFEISEQMYCLFDTFEREDLKYLNVVDRHLEQAEVREGALEKRAQCDLKSIENIVMENWEKEQLYESINQLPDIQKRRLIMYYWGGNDLC